MNDFQEIRDTSPLSLKVLNDQLRMLHYRSMNVTDKDLRPKSVTSEAIGLEVIEGKHIKPKSITTESIDARLATIDHIEAITERVNILEADTIRTEEFYSETADIRQLLSEKVTSIEFEGQIARFDTLESDYGIFKVAVADTFTSTLATIDTVITNKAISELLTAGKIIAGSSIIAEGAIGSAQISDLDVSKLNAGDISTAKFKVIGTDGRLIIQDNLLQVFDGAVNPFERIALGDINKDGSVYGLRIRGADGATILFDENGQTKEGFTDGYAKLPDNSLNPDKINIEQIFERINEDGSNTIISTKILLGDRTLDVKFTEITEVVSGHTQSISTYGTQIEAVQGSITNKVWMTDVEEFMDTKADRADIENLWTNMTHAETAIIQLSDSMSLYAQKTEINSLLDTISEMSTNIDLNTSAINLAASKQDVDFLSGLVESQQAQITLMSDRVTLDFTRLNQELENATTDLIDMRSYFDFSADYMKIGKSNSPFNITISDFQMDFLDSGATVAYINGQKYYITHGHILNTLTVGVHMIEKYNDEISFVRWVGGGN